MVGKAIRGVRSSIRVRGVNLLLTPPPPLDVYESYKIFNPTQIKNVYLYYIYILIILYQLYFYLKNCFV